MIRINLLKPLMTSAQGLPNLVEEGTGRRKTVFMVLGGVIVVAIAVALLQYPTLLGGMLSREKPVAVKTAPEKPKPSAPEHVPPKVVTAQAVEETVRDIAPEAAPKLTSTYADLVPSEKIEFQYYAAKRILKDIKAVTPPEVGFANFIFSPPGDFYVHGLAPGEEDYQRFKQGLAGLMGASIRPGLNVPAGAHGKGKEFSFYGSVKYPVNAIPTPPDRVVSKAKLVLEMNTLKKVAGSLGIRLQPMKLLSSTAVGKLSKQVYQTTADCSYQQMQDLLSELYQNKSNLGFLKFDLHARGDEQVVADLAILAYVN